MIVDHLRREVGHHILNEKVSDSCGPKRIRDSSIYYPDACNQRIDIFGFLNGGLGSIEQLVRHDALAKETGPQLILQRARQHLPLLFAQLQQPGS